MPNTAESYEKRVNINQTAIDRLKLDEAFVGKMIHRAFNECWTVKCDEKLTVVDDNRRRCGGLCTF